MGIIYKALDRQKSTMLSLGSILLVCILCLSGCNKKSADIPDLDEISLKSDELLLEELKGIDRKDLNEAWGNPDKFGMGMPFDIWYLEHYFDGEKVLSGDHITVYYYDGKVISASYADVFYATILEVYENHIMIKPVEGEWELNNSDQIIVYTDETPEETKDQFEEGVMVKIGYNGLIMETYPAQINHDYIYVID